MGTVGVVRGHPRINRRLRLMDGQPDRESILVQLRRERGLTSGGLYSLPVLSLNRLVLQSGLAMGLTKFLLVDAIATRYWLSSPSR